ncbi:hypothetical protein IID22_01805 [Patescibacteria group bacterium]|nr:hypothetical protein [Patescibacteria group bacterium]
MSKKLSGTLGIVLVPDPETEKVLRGLTEKYSKEGDILPEPYHLSLYHGNFKNFPEEGVAALIEQVSFLPGTDYELNQIEPYGGKFLFWNVEKPYPNLQRAHETAVETLSPFVDQEKAGLALKEGLKMTQQEIENLRRYSYPLVKELFMPHYSLLYRKGGVENTGSRHHQARITQVQFVEIGGYSKISQVFLSSRD